MLTVFFGAENYGAKEVYLALSRFMTPSVIMTKFSGITIPIEDATAGTVVNSSSTLKEDACKIGPPYYDPGRHVYEWYIENGICIMPSGAIYKVSERFFLTTPDVLYKKYIYLSQDINGGPIKFSIADTAPQKYDVPLAYIENNEVYDMRIPAYSRLQMPAWSKNTASRSLEFDVNIPEEKYIDMSYSNFSYCHMTSQGVFDENMPIQPQRLTREYTLLGYRYIMAYYVRREGNRIYIKTEKSGHNAQPAGNGICDVVIF